MGIKGRVGTLLAAALLAVGLAACGGGEPVPEEVAVYTVEIQQPFTGREPRLLLNYELNALMEDMKTSGLRPGRLKEMLKFFYRGWTELAADDV